jgi:hypothetical protein
MVGKISRDEVTGGALAWALRIIGIPATALRVTGSAGVPKIVTSGA